MLPLKTGQGVAVLTGHPTLADALTDFITLLACSIGLRNTRKNHSSCGRKTVSRFMRRQCFDRATCRSILITSTKGGVVAVLSFSLMKGNSLYGY